MRESGSPGRVNTYTHTITGIHMGISNIHIHMGTGTGMTTIMMRTRTMDILIHTGPAIMIRTIAPG